MGGTADSHGLAWSLNTVLTPVRRWTTLVFVHAAHSLWELQADALGHDGPRTRAAGRAKQAVDYGRRGKGYVFGAFIPATGAALILRVSTGAKEKGITAGIAV